MEIILYILACWLKCSPIFSLIVYSHLHKCEKEILTYTFQYKCHCLDFLTCIIKTKLFHFFAFWFLLWQWNFLTSICIQPRNLETLPRGFIYDHKRQLCNAEHIEIVVKREGVWEIAFLLIRINCLPLCTSKPPRVLAPLTGHHMEWIEKLWFKDRATLQWQIFKTSGARSTS